MTNRPSRKWRDVLVHVAARQDGEATAAQVADEMDLTYASAGQLLGRLRRWGKLRVVGFEDAVATNPPPGKKRKRRAGAGRARLVYEITEAGRKYLEHLRGRREEE